MMNESIAGEGGVHANREADSPGRTPGQEMLVGGIFGELTRLKVGYTRRKPAPPVN